MRMSPGHIPTIIKTRFVNSVAGIFRPDYFLKYCVRKCYCLCTVNFNSMFICCFILWFYNRLTEIICCSVESESIETFRDPCRLRPLDQLITSR